MIEKLLELRDLLFRIAFEAEGMPAVTAIGVHSFICRGSSERLRDVDGGAH